jgi:hypothetical protein
MIIQRDWLLDHNIRLLDADRDLWLINDPIEDAEGFWKECYFIATTAGINQFETITPIGTSYSDYAEIRELVDEWWEKNIK